VLEVLAIVAIAPEVPEIVIGPVRVSSPPKVVVLSVTSSNGLLIDMIVVPMLESPPPFPVIAPLEGRAPELVIAKVPLNSVMPPEKVLDALEREREEPFKSAIERDPAESRSVIAPLKVEDVLAAIVKVLARASIPEVPPKVETVMPELVSIPRVAPDTTVKESTVSGLPKLLINITGPVP
jgi:hypothetical protein